MVFIKYFIEELEERGQISRHTAISKNHTRYRAASVQSCNNAPHKGSLWWWWMGIKIQVMFLSPSWARVINCISLRKRAFLYHVLWESYLLENHPLERGLFLWFIQENHICYDAVLRQYFVLPPQNTSLAILLLRGPCPPSAIFFSIQHCTISLLAPVVTEIQLSLENGAKSMRDRGKTILGLPPSLGSLPVPPIPGSNKKPESKGTPVKKP